MPGPQFPEIHERAMLALTQVRLTAEQKESQGYGLTDSDVLEAVEDWASGVCPEACTSSECCDYQRLGFLVWRVVEQLR